jgi:hypothetical protein
VYLVIYQLAQGLPCKAINNIFDVKSLPLENIRLLFEKYIHAPTGHKIIDIIHKFHDIIGLPNVADVMYDTHIILSTKSQRDLISMFCDFFNKCF